MSSLLLTSAIDTPSELPAQYLGVLDRVYSRAIVIDNVPNISRIETQMQDLLSKLRVADGGGGFTVPTTRPVMPPAHEVNHRGLALMYALVDRVDVVSTARGTAVVLAQALGANQPASASAGAGASPGALAARAAT